MKTTRRLLALALALCLGGALCACAPVSTEEPASHTALAQSPLPTGKAAAIAYYNTLLSQAMGSAKSAERSLSYGVSNMDCGNALAASHIKRYLAEWLQAQETLPAPEEGAPLSFAGVPSPLSAIAAESFFQRLAVRELADVKGEEATDEDRRRCQLDGDLNLDYAAQLLPLPPKSSILAELKRAEAYLLAEDYRLELTGALLTALADKTNGRLLELRVELQYRVTAQAQGRGALAGEGEIPMAFTLTKTLQYAITWEEGSADA
jgi:hypothetical protein